MHFILIANNPNINIQVPEYITFMRRPNIGYDFGGWSDACDRYKSRLRDYDYIIFANSFIGPFHCKKEEWPHIFKKGLDKNVKLFGVTINTIENPNAFAHVQSYLFIMDVDTVFYLIREGIFSVQRYAKTHTEAVKKEIEMSRKIIKKGWNIASLLPYYNGIDFRMPYKSKNPPLRDLMYKRFEEKGFWKRQELIFIKGNRDLNPCKN